MRLSLRGIVLAAGESTRMGSPKALLPDGNGRLFIARVLHSLRAGGLNDLVVVTGALHARIVRAVADDVPLATNITFMRNPDPSRGQLSSLLAGLAAAVPGVEAVLVTLVDVPFVAPATVAAVIDAYRTTRAPIVRPARGGRHGHPVLFARSLFGDLRTADLSAGAKTVVRAHASAIVDVEVDDAGALIDLDTPDEYERLVRS